MLGRPLADFMSGAGLVGVLTWYCRRVAWTVCVLIHRFGPESRRSLRPGLDREPAGPANLRQAEGQHESAANAHTLGEGSAAPQHGLARSDRWSNRDDRRRFTELLVGMRTINAVSEFYRFVRARIRLDALMMRPDWFTVLRGVTNT